VKRYPPESLQTCLLYAIIRATGVQERLWRFSTLLWRFYTKSRRIYRKVWKFSQIAGKASKGVEILYKLCKVYMMIEES
jgi:hypothetical protein